MPVERSQLESLRIDRAALPDEESPRGRKWIVLAAIIAVVALALFVFLRPRAVAVKVATVEERSGQGGAGTVLNASGYVTARRQATISAKITGRVAEILVEEGMKVEKDQVLARLDDAPFRAQLALAEAQLQQAQRAVAETEVRLAQAQRTAKRAQELQASGVGSQADLDAAQADADALQAQLAVQRQQVEVAGRQVGVARQDLSETVVRAPFAGVAISKDAQPGEIVSPMSAGGGFTRTGLSTIVDMASLEIEVDVNEAYIQRVEAGQKVTATLDAYPEWQIPAHVITIIPAADRQKATVKVRIGFDRLDPRILPDMGVKVAFLGEAPGTAGGRVRLVPRAALHGDSGQEFVWVVGSENRLERRAVKPSPSSSDPAEILAGLQPGERVVVGGPADLAEGRQVKIE
ncbi:MAG: efflux RND transporter periplasmic adaptor subunit [Acidobacteriota bacterium]